MKRNSISGLGLLLCSVTVFGCGRRQSAGDARVADAQAKVAAIAAGPVSDKAPPPSAESPFTHPIDLIPEGLEFRRASKAIDGGDLETARGIAQELKQSEQYSPLATAIEALMMVKQGNYDEAIKLAGDISTVPVMQPEAYVIAAEVFQRQNQLQEAIGALENALEMNPQHVRAHLLLGAIYYDTGAMRFATGQLRQAAELDPDEKNALMLSAKIFKEYEQYQEAITDYQELLSRSLTEEMQIYVNIELASCLLELRQLDDAREILSSCPDTAGVLAVRAAIAETAGEFEKAAKLARSALEIAPENLTAGMILGRISVTERNWDEAVEVLQKLVNTRPYDHEPRLLFGRALVGSGDVERGQVEIETATDLKDTFLEFADLHQQAIKQPDDPQLRVELGRLAEKLGKVDLARTWYQAALGLSPDQPEAAAGMKRLAP